MQNQLYDPNLKFDTQLNYCNMIMQKIQEIQFSLRAGQDCTREFSNLLALLTNGIKDPIKPELLKITNEYKIKIENIRKMQDFPETTFPWSGRHKLKYIGVLINREQSDAIRDMIPVIINRLDEMGLLLNREKQIQI